MKFVLTATFFQEKNSNLTGRASGPFKPPMHTRSAYLLNKALGGQKRKSQSLDPVSITPPKKRRITDSEEVVQAGKISKPLLEPIGEYLSHHQNDSEGIGSPKTPISRRLFNPKGKSQSLDPVSNTPPEIMRITDPDEVVQAVVQTPGKTSKPLLQPNGVYLSPQQAFSPGIPRRLFDPQDVPLDLSPSNKESRVKARGETPTIQDLGHQEDYQLSVDYHQEDYQPSVDYQELDSLHEVQSRDNLGGELEPIVNVNPIESSQHEFQPGRVPQVNWLGTVPCLGDENLISDYYFLSPGYNAICLRATLSVPMQKVWQYVGKQMRHCMEKPIMCYIGAEVDMATQLNKYPPNATFTIHDGSLPEEFLDHKGKLWQCMNCSNPGYKAKKNFNGKKCINNNPHMFFCDGEVPLSWGHIVPNKNKVTVPWGAPVRLRGSKSQPAPVHPPISESEPTKGSSSRNEYQVSSRLGSRRSSISPSQSPSSSPPQVGHSAAQSRGTSSEVSVSTPSEYSVGGISVFKKKTVGDQLQNLIEDSVCTVPLSVQLEMGKTENRPTADPRTKGKRTKGQRCKGELSKSTAQLEPMEKEKGSSTYRTRGNRIDYTKQLEPIGVEEGGDLESESEEDYELDEGDDHSSESGEEENGNGSGTEMKSQVGAIITCNKSHKKSWMEIHEDPVLTDDEEEDSEHIRQARRAGAFQLRQEMQARRNEIRNANLAADKYIADERDVQLISEHITKPLLAQAKKWQKHKKHIKKDVKEMVARGELPKGDNSEAWADIVYTPVSYLRGLKVLLGKYQKELLERGLLQNDRLHIWAMMEEFKTEHHVEFPEIIIHLLEEVSTPSMAKFALAGFCQLIDSRIVHISKPKGQAQFYRKTPKEAKIYTTDEDEIDFKHLVREQLEREKTRLNNLKSTILKGKPYQQFQASVDMDAKEKKEFMKEFYGADTPLLADAVPRYMQCKDTKLLYEELSNLSSKKAKIKPRKLLELGMGLAKRWHLKQSHRIEWVNKFTYGHWLTLTKGSWNKFPHVSGELTEEEKELVKCMSVEIGKNKVTDRPIVFNLSKIDVIMGRCYEALRNDVLVSLNLDINDHDRPFFINSKGKPLYHPKSSQFNWTDFSIVARCGPVTSHMARKMQAQFITLQKDALLLEAREFMLNHSEAVDKRFYQNSFRQSDLAKYGQSKIRTMLDLEEDREAGVEDKEQQVYVDKEQQERERRGHRKTEQDMLERFLEQERQIDEKVESNLQRFVTNRIKLATVEAIIYCTNKPITNKGELCDIFMTGQYVRRKSCTSILIRMIHLIPPDVACIRILRESLLKFVELNEGVTDLRLLEWRWSFRLTQCLHKMSKTHSLGSQNLLHTLAMFNKEKMNKYCFNNLTIFNLVSQWQAKEYVREARLIGENSMVSIDDFLAAKRVEVITGNAVRAMEAPKELESHAQHAAPQYLLESCDQEQQFKKWPAHTSSPVFDDDMKLDFLEQFILAAEDPSLRSKTPKGKAIHNFNLTPMMNSVGVIVSGHSGRFLLSTLVAGEDTLAQYLQMKGLSRQMKKWSPPKSGLLGLVDMWLETQEDQSNEALRANVGELIEFAKNLNL